MKYNICIVCKQYTWGVIWITECPNNRTLDMLISIVFHYTFVTVSPMNWTDFPNQNKPKCNPARIIFDCIKQETLLKIWYFYLSRIDTNETRLLLLCLVHSLCILFTFFVERFTRSWASVRDINWYSLRFRMMFRTQFCRTKAGTTLSPYNWNFSPI